MKETLALPCRQQAQEKLAARGAVQWHSGTCMQLYAQRLNRLDPIDY
jgi:hypothetical protein